MHRIGGDVNTRAGLNIAEYIKLYYSCWELNPDFSEVQLEDCPYTDWAIQALLAEDYKLLSMK
jgi:hypothetical protein